MSALPHSTLSRRLLIGLFVASLTYWVLIAWLTFRDSVDEVHQLFDAHLAQTALAVLHITDPDDGDPVVMPSTTAVPALREIFGQWPALPGRAAPASKAMSLADGELQSVQREYEKRLRYQVWSSKGDLLLRSANANGESMTDQDGYSQTTDQEGSVWRHYVVWDQDKDFRVVVSEDYELRLGMVRRFALHVARPLALGLPVLIVLLWLSVRRGLTPLAALTREIQGRKPDNLQAIDVVSAPGEVQPVLTALNQLLVRVDQALEGERRFTSNAAHELRTPLAAIQVHLHLARSAVTEDERQHAMAQLEHGVDRGIRLIGQLLTLARLDPEQALPQTEVVDLGALAQAVCAELAPLALQREQALALEVEPNLPTLLGNGDMLSMLVGNLLDNAIRYSPQGGHIQVDIGQSDAGLQMTVSDDGPGIPTSLRQRVFDRFYRGAGQSQAGTGLGLSICKRIAELHDARLRIDDAAGQRGTAVHVLFSRSTSDRVPNKSPARAGL